MEFSVSSGFTAALEHDQQAQPGLTPPPEQGTKYVHVRVHVCTCTSGCGFDPALEVFEHSHNKQRGYNYSSK